MDNDKALEASIDKLENEFRLEVVKNMKIAEKIFEDAMKNEEVKANKEVEDYIVKELEENKDKNQEQIKKTKLNDADLDNLLVNENEDDKPMTSVYKAIINIVSNAPEEQVVENKEEATVSLTLYEKMMLLRTTDIENREIELMGKKDDGYGELNNNERGPLDPPKGLKFNFKKVKATIQEKILNVGPKLYESNSIDEISIPIDIFSKIMATEVFNGFYKIIQSLIQLANIAEGELSESQVIVNSIATELLMKSLLINDRIEGQTEDINPAFLKPISNANGKEIKKTKKGPFSYGTFIDYVKRYALGDHQTFLLNAGKDVVLEYRHIMHDLTEIDILFEKNQQDLDQKNSPFYYTLDKYLNFIIENPNTNEVFDAFIYLHQYMISVDNIYSPSESTQNNNFLYIKNTLKLDIDEIKYQRSIIKLAENLRIAGLIADTFLEKLNKSEKAFRYLSFTNGLDVNNQVAFHELGNNLACYLLRAIGNEVSYIYPLQVERHLAAAAMGYTKIPDFIIEYMDNRKTASERFLFKNFSKVKNKQLGFKMNVKDTITLYNLDYFESVSYALSPLYTTIERHVENQINKSSKKPFILKSFIAIHKYNADHALRSNGTYARNVPTMNQLLAVGFKVYNVLKTTPVMIFSEICRITLNELGGSTPDESQHKRAKICKTHPFYIGKSYNNVPFIDGKDFASIGFEGFNFMLVLKASEIAVETPLLRLLKRLNSEFSYEFNSPCLAITVDYENNDNFNRKAQDYFLGFDSIEISREKTYKLSSIIMEKLQKGLPSTYKTISITAQNKIRVKKDLNVDYGDYTQTNLVKVFEDLNSRPLMIFYQS